MTALAFPTPYLSQHGRILAHFNRYPDVWVKNTDFMKEGSIAPFIGYQAATLLSLLATRGILETRWIRFNDKNRKEYKLSKTVNVMTGTNSKGKRVVWYRKTQK